MASTVEQNRAVPNRAKPNLWSGPGLIFALSMLGPGGVVSNVTIGATHRYSLLWVLVLVLAFRFVWLSTSARYVIVTGESLLTGFRRKGRWIPWTVFGSLLLSRHLSNLYKVLLMGAAAQILIPLPIAWGAAAWSIVFMGVGYLLMTRQVRTLDRWCRPMIASMGLALIVAASLSHPDFPAILRGLFIPILGGEKNAYGTLLLITALIGAEAGAIDNASYSYFLSQRGWGIGTFLRRQRLDLLVSIGCVFFMDTLLQIASAGTLWPAHLVPKNAEELIPVFFVTLGIAGRIIFAFGLWAVCFSGFVAATNGSSLVAADIWLNTIPSTTKGQPTGSAAAEISPKVRLYLLTFWALSPIYILFTHVQPIWLVLIVSSLKALLIPGMAVALWFISNDRERLGEYKNGLFTNTLFAILILTTLYISVRNAVELLHKL